MAPELPSQSCQFDNSLPLCQANVVLVSSCIMSCLGAFTPCFELRLLLRQAYHLILASCTIAITAFIALPSRTFNTSQHTGGKLENLQHID